MAEVEEGSGHLADTAEAPTYTSDRAGGGGRAEAEGGEEEHK